MKTKHKRFLAIIAITAFQLVKKHLQVVSYYEKETRKKTIRNTNISSQPTERSKETRTIEALLYQIETRKLKEKEADYI